MQWTTCRIVNNFCDEHNDPSEYHIPDIWEHDNILRDGAQLIPDHENAERKYHIHHIWDQEDRCPDDMPILC